MLRAIILSIVAFIVLLLVFMTGTFVGFKKADFSYKWGENYHQNFAGPRQGFFGDFERRDFIEPHGVIGQIIKIDGSTIIIKGKDNLEKIVLVKNDTLIRRLNETIKSSDLKTDDLIVILGQPNDAGQIEAKLIRVFNEEPKGPPMSYQGGPR